MTMEHPNTTRKQLLQLFGEVYKPQLFRIAGIFTFLLAFIFSFSCSSPKDISEKPLYAIYKFRKDDNTLRTVFIEQLILAKVPHPAHPLVFALAAGGPAKKYQSGDRENELAAFFLDEESFTGLRYCEALELHYVQHVIPIPQEGIGAIWNFLKE